MLLKYGSEYQELYDAIEIVLARLGDIPTIKYMYEKIKDIEYKQNTLHDIIMYPEVFVKKVVNEIKIDTRSLTFTDFQAQVYRELNKGKDISFSAPPSAGKSFVVHNYISNKIHESEKYIVVYVVPTKALITDVQTSIISILKKIPAKSDDISISNSIERFNISSNIKTNKKLFVLTQERLRSLLISHPKFHADLLIIDEAQNINDPERGVILENTVNDFIAINNKMQKIIISPFVQNPEKFLDVFGIQNKDTPLYTESTPVGQNIFYINFGKKQLTSTLFLQEMQFITENDNLLMENKSIKKTPSSKYEKTVLVVDRFLGKQEQTIVYCNRRDECIKTANKLLEIRTNYKNIEISENLKSIIDFLRTNVHQQYILADCLEFGVGFHHGKMQQFIRFIIEQAFIKEEIIQLCCTSTLLEGVNLPAKNIVLFEPKLKKFDIKNLAGRAGRLKKGYYGNVYCINIEDWDESNIFDKSPEIIESSIEKIFRDDTHKVIQHLHEYTDYRYNRNPVINTTTNLIVRHIESSDNSVIDNLEKKYKTISQDQLKIIKAELSIIKKKLSNIDPEIFSNNRSIDPRLIHNLYSHMYEQSKLIYPLPVEHKNFDNHLYKIFILLRRFIIRREKRKDISYYSFIAANWIKQQSYGDIIKNGLEYHSKNDKKIQDKDKINSHIEKINSILEEKLKYEFARAIKCYCDLIKYIVKEKNLNSIHPINYNIPDYLESGAYKKNMLYLLDLGISRNNAIHISKLIDHEMQNVDKIIQWLSEHRSDIKSILHPYMFDEFEHFLKTKW